MQNRDESHLQSAQNASDIAVVGMAAHLPGSATLEEYWANLRDGLCSIKKLDDDALLEAGVTDEQLADPNYVKAAATLENFDHFDGEFFGFSPKDAAILDPQHRQFLEVAWEALENAAHDPEHFAGEIGVFAGCGVGTYFHSNLCSHQDLVDNVGLFLLRHTGNDKDFLATRVSHVLDLKGPSIGLQTACSTSLVATHYACQSLISGDCDMALAGGVTIEMPHGRGYQFKENEILSPDGECHAFDARAAGTVFGSGAGVVVLRRLKDALADGDHIWAVIKGSAVNNDGAAKAGYLAPSVERQADAVAAAHNAAGVDAESIGFIECHGTGTYLGDPIEVSALTDAFRRSTDRTEFCRIGSVKTNIGHLDTAAGIAGLIKASLSLDRGQIPPSLGYSSPNPAIDFETSPFRVNDSLADWPKIDGPRRAAVNSLGVGGTNAHLVLEQAPIRAESEDSDWPFHVLTLSGRTPAALDANAENLAEYLRANHDVPLADIAFTLKEGRRGFKHRRTLVVENHDGAARLLEQKDPQHVFDHEVVRQDPDVVFMFPGGGAQYANMAEGLYETEPVFRDWMDRGFECIQPALDYDIRALWLAKAAERETAEQRLKQPSVQLPLIAMVEYALAKLWMSWGVQPAALVGHSMGENVAACLAGVMTFEECIRLVHLRGQLFDSLPDGGMMSVPLPVSELEPLLSDELDIAGVNAPRLTVISGPKDDLSKLKSRLVGMDVECADIPIDVAAHSRMLEPILGPFREFVASLDLKAPQLPFLSNRSGEFITEAEATDPDYWVAHLRNTVNFADCLETLAREPKRIYLEVGPGAALSSLAKQAKSISANQVLTTLRHPKLDVEDDAFFLGVVGRMWAVGVKADWGLIWSDRRRNRVQLPTYAFQRSRYFIEPDKRAHLPAAASLRRQDDISDWGYNAAWRRRWADCDIDIAADLPNAPNEKWLIFADQAGLSDRIVRRLRSAGQSVVEVRSGDTYARRSDNCYSLSPELGRAGYDALFADLASNDQLPTRIGHFWLVTSKESFRPGSSEFHRNLEHGYHSLLHLAQAVDSIDDHQAIHLAMVSNGAAKVSDEQLSYPEKSLATSAAGVISREIPDLTCSTLDVELPALSRKGWLRSNRVAESAWDELVDAVLEELFATPTNCDAALRGSRRLERHWRPASLSSQSTGTASFVSGGTYMITGGFGGIGMTLAEHLATTYQANIVLLSRIAMPDRTDWDKHLSSHGSRNAISGRIRFVQKLEALGSWVQHSQADICNIDEMQHVVATAKERFGSIDGVIHAAGSINDAPLLAKDVHDLEPVLAPKINGTMVLDQLFPDGDLDLLVLCSSTSAVTNPIGQIDYAPANAYLNAYAQSRKGDKTRVLAINWGIWADVGMAANALVNAAHDDELSPAPALPLFDATGFDATDRRVFTADLGAEASWIINEHRTSDGSAVMPGTGYLELAAEALKGLHSTGAFEIRDLSFVSPLIVEDSKTTPLRVGLRENSEGFEFEVISEIAQDGRSGSQLHAKALLSTIDQPNARKLDLTEIKARCGRPETGNLRSSQEEHLNFGPRWRVLKERAYGTGEGLAKLKLADAFQKDLDDGIILHPALMDIATGWATGLIEGYTSDHLWVPASYKLVRSYRSLPRTIASWIRHSDSLESGDGFVSFDVTLTDEDGNICVEIEGFTMMRLDETENFGATDTAASAQIQFHQDGASSPQPSTPAEKRLRHNLTQGIRSAEGPEALERALATGLNQVVVSSLDLNGLIEQADMAANDVKSIDQTFERPELQSDFVEPRNGIEAKLAEFWQQLLGVDKIGVEDSFFDLGGHSLIAVRLFSMIKREYQCEFPISVLFEAPTIAKCAALIEERVGPVDKSENSEPKAVSSTTGYNYVVPLNDVSKDGTPFFIVAGMFGNVLNLRHLAQLLGTDRPVYGLQARGLLGGMDPHETLADAASDYIAEMRQVQPTGPYLVGGFSGGGLTAYEIAHQLKEDGENVSLLAMLDTPLPMRPGLSKADKAMIKLAELRVGGLRFVAKWVTEKYRWHATRRRAGNLPLGEQIEDGFQNSAIENAFRDALPQYDLKPWGGLTVLFRPPLDLRWKVSKGQFVSEAREYVLDDNGWADWVEHLIVDEVPGDHDSMVLEPNVRVLAARLAQYLSDVEAKNADPTASHWPSQIAAE